MRILPVFLVGEGSRTSPRSKLQTTVETGVLTALTLDRLYNGEMAASGSTRDKAHGRTDWLRTVPWYPPSCISGPARSINRALSTSGIHRPQASGRPSCRCTGGSGGFWGGLWRAVRDSKGLGGARKGLEGLFLHVAWQQQRVSLGLS